MTTEAMPIVTRQEIAAAIREPLAREPLTGEQLVTEAQKADARQEVITLLQTLPKRRYGRLTELWPALAHVPVSA